jgi:hypothetical protein
MSMSKPKSGSSRQKAKGIDDALGGDHRRVVPVVLVRVEQSRTEAPAQPREIGRSVHGWA